MFKALIFDLDGTLVNTLDDIADAANAALMKYEIKPHPVAAYRQFVGDGLQVLIERILPEKSRTEKNILLLSDRFREFYKLSWNRKSKPYSGIEEMLNTLWENGIKLAVLSNKPDFFTKLYISKYFKPHLFSIVQGYLENVPKKPDPEGALHITKQLELKPEQIVFVGDSANDIITGKRAGMVTIGVEWGFRDIEELIEIGADRIVKYPSDITQFVLGNM